MLRKTLMWTVSIEVIRGLISCGLCGRRMEGSFNHGRLYYRCTASRDFVRQHGLSHPPMLYLREESIADPSDRFLDRELGQGNLTSSLRRIAEAEFRAALAAHDPDDEAGRLRDRIADADARIDRYRAALDAGADPAVVAGWIKEATALRRAALARLGLVGEVPQRMSEDQVAAIVEALGGLLGLLKQAEKQDRAEIYSRLGLRMTYRPGTETVLAEIVSTNLDRVGDVCPRIDVNQIPMPADHRLGYLPGLGSVLSIMGVRSWRRPDLAGPYRMGVWPIGRPGYAIA